MSSVCPNCGHHLTDGYVRVFGDNSDEVICCLHCEENVHVTERETSGVDEETRYLKRMSDVK